MSIFYYDSPAGRDFRDQVTKVFQAAGGRVVFSQAGTFDDPSTSTYVARSRAENVDMSMFWGEPGLWVKMIREAAIQAYKPPKGFWGCACLYFDQIPGLAGPWAEGSISAVDWVPNDIVATDPAKAPGYAEYNQILTRYYPDIKHSNWTRAGYAGARLFGDTLKKLGLNVTRQGLKDALDKTSVLDLGLGPKLQFWKDHRAVHSTYLLRLEKDTQNPTSGGMRWKYFAGPFTDQWNKP
jgi:ABC-type branched-subunit amino acid transport system substrate-binding protein